MRDAEVRVAEEVVVEAVALRRERVVEVGAEAIALKMKSQRERDRER